MTSEKNMRMIKLIASAMLVSTSGIAIAQDASGDDAGVETVEEASNGAVVTRDEITEQVLGENGEPVPALDVNGDPILDADGNPVFATQVVGFTQTVETPSGITTTVTKVDGSPAVVTFQNLGRPAAATAAADGRSRADEARLAASQAAATARDSAATARDGAAAARDNASSARDTAAAARENARNIPRPGRPGG